MNWPCIISALALFFVLLTWGIHYTAWQDGRLAGLAEAERRQRRADQDRSKENELLRAQRDDAIEAVARVLGVICQNPVIGSQIGDDTEPYDLLCQAIATRQGVSLEKVQQTYRPARWKEAS